MTGTAREKDQADFDLERFINMFDEALTSKDPRVMDALRGLMMIVTLTRPESRNSGLHDRASGPLRRLYEDMHNLNRRLGSVEDHVQQLNREYTRNNVWAEKEKYSMVAAAQMAQEIDEDVMRQITRKINGGYTLGPETKSKGLLDK